MTIEPAEKETKAAHSPAGIAFGVLVLIGAVAFGLGLAGSRPGHAWQAYLINFLLWTALAAGALLFSAVMQVTEARWSGRLAGIAESFGAFFPVSFFLFLVLFFGRSHIFPWLHEELHGGKAVWLTLPFLFGRDAAALALLCGAGFGYLYNSLRLRFGGTEGRGWLRERLQRRWAGKSVEEEALRRRTFRWAVVYCLSFALVLSLIGYDLVMAVDPYWVSTLFGAYSFVKAFYLGLGGLIITASILYLRHGEKTGLSAGQFHDVGKLLLAFCLVWGDFFCAQFVVVWYGNIAGETGFVIERTVTAPWRSAAWAVLLVCFVGPFLILINKKIKTVPWAMIALCSAVLVGMYLEHLLLLGPALSRGASRLPVDYTDLLIFAGFFGLMAYMLRTFMKQFPETVLLRRTESS